MTELVRGTVGDRPWGFTLGALGLRRLTGQLTLQHETKYYCIAFDDGMIVGATSPLAGDSVARIALINHFATSPQIAAITRRIAAQPERDEVDILAEMNQLNPDQKFRLRCRVIAQRAARTFSVERGDFIVHDEVTISTHPEVAADVRGIVFLGARMNLPEQRLSDDLRPFGTQFQMRATAGAELNGFGFADGEWAIVEAIRAGASLPELEARYRDVDPRTLRAIVYAMLSCGAMDAVAANPLPSGPMPRTITVSPQDVSAGAGFKMRERKPVTTASDLLAKQEQATFEPSRTATNTRPIEPRTTTTGARPLGASTLPPRTMTSEARDPFGGSPLPPRTTTTEPRDPFAGMPLPPRTTTTEPRDPFAGSPLPPRTTTTEPRDPFTGSPPRTMTTEPRGLYSATPAAPRTTTTEPRDPFQPPSRTMTSEPTTPIPSRTSTPLPGAPGTTRPHYGIPTSPRTEPGVGGVARPPLAAASPLAPSPPSAARAPTPPTQGPPIHVHLPERMASPRRTNPQILAVTDDGANTPMALPGAPRTTTPTAPPMGQGTPTEPLAARANTLDSHVVAKGTQQGPNPVTAGESAPTGPSFPRAPTPLPTRATTAPPTSRTPTDPVPSRAPTDPTAGRTPTPSMADVLITGRAPTPNPITGRATTDPAVARTTSDASDSASRRMPSGSIPPPRTRTNPTYTTDPEPPRTTTDQSVLAEEAFTRGKTALRREELGEAIAELTRAAELNPQDVDYQAILAWARFCAASDKNSVAEHTRKVLGRAVVKSNKPEVARFYLGRVERMVGRDKEALRHFQAVLEAQPRHADAAAEVRMLEARIASDKGGFFGRKK